MFHHNGQLVLDNKDTNFKDLQWKYFGSFGLTWNDIFNGVYSLANYIPVWNNGVEPFEDINEATQFAEKKQLKKELICIRIERWISRRRTIYELQLGNVITI